MSKARTAVVIGGGLGGLAATIRLARRGYGVTLCEQGPALGGKMNRWTSAGFTFDTGPSLITMPWVFAELFALAGHRLEDHLKLVRVRPLARYHYADGTAFDHTTYLPDWLKTVQQLAPGDVDGFFRFMHLGARLYALSAATFLERAPIEPPAPGALRSLRHFPIRRAWGNYAASVAAHFQSPHLRQLYNRYPTYVGSSPYACPATFALIPYLEYAFAGWYVEGGLYRIVQALSGIATELGAGLRTGAKVVRIECAGRRATAVHLADGTRVPADVVVMNGDASYAPALLLGQPGPGLPPPDRSLSGLVILAGVRRRLPEVHHHNVYFSANYPAEFHTLFDTRQFPDDPTVYVNVPSRSDRSCAPADGETLFIMANAPADAEPWDAAQTARARDHVFARLRASGFPDIEDTIATERIITPRTMAEAYGMPGGAIYGTHSHGWRRAFGRPPNRDRKVRGLYYVGGSTHPGGGTPIVLLSAKIVERLIQHDERG